MKNTYLFQILNPFMLRRVKSDVELDVPPKREILVYAPMTELQETQYKSIVDKSIRRLVEKETVGSGILFFAFPPFLVHVQKKRCFNSCCVFSFG